MERIPLIRKIKNKFLERHFEESLLFISVGVLSALICSVYAKLFAWVETTSIQLFSSYPLALYLAAPMGLVISYYLVRRLAPGSSGSGIPQVLTIIEEPRPKLIKLFLRKTVIIVKIFSSLIAVFVGAAIGREGPSLQVAAAVAYNLGRFSSRFGVKIRVDQLLTAGAASGLAAAFNTPIGGIVYAIEELSKEHVRTFRDILLLSVVLSGLTAQVISGNYLYLGLPFVQESYSIPTLLSIAACGLLCGFLGACFSKGLAYLIKWRSKKSVQAQILILIMIGLFFASVFYFGGERNLYSGKESINHVLFSQAEVPWYEMLSRIFMPLLSSMTGIAGGIFAPSLSAGAVVGGTLSQFMDPSVRTILGLSGMVGFLTGVTHTPITSFILVLEMTDRHAAVFPMMIAAIFSSLGAHLISELSFYEEVVLDIKQNHQE